MIIEENEKNRIKKLHRNQFVLKEGMFVSPQGELMDDDMESIKIGDEVKVLVWELVQDMAFPGHYGTVSIIGTHERNGKPKGVVIDEVLQDDDESILVDDDPVKKKSKPNIISRVCDYISVHSF